MDKHWADKMEDMDRQFMIEQGDYILRNFYHDFYNNDYSKLQPDKEFLNDFYNCIKLHDGEQHLTTLIKSTKPNL